MPGLHLSITGAAVSKDGISMRLASFKVKGRSSYGAVTDGGIIDLARKLP